MGRGLKKSVKPFEDKRITQLLEDYGDYLVHFRGFTEITKKDYYWIISSFLRKNNISTLEEVIAIKTKDLKEYVTTKNYAEETINMYIKAFKSLMKYLKEEKKYDVDAEFEALRTAKVHKKEAFFLDEEEVHKMMVYSLDIDTQLIIMILWDTALRISELLQITCKDIENGYVCVRGKGKKDRTVWFKNSTIQVGMNFIKGKRAKILRNFETDRSNDILLISDSGTPFTPPAIRHKLRETARLANIEGWEKVCTHTLRHSSISGYLSKGVALNVVRDFAGHENISTTNKYTHAKEKEIKMMILGDEYEKRVAQEKERKEGA